MKKNSRVDRPAQKTFEVDADEVSQALGSQSEAFQLTCLTQALKALWHPDGTPEEIIDRDVLAVYDVLRSIAPRSELESMLAVQMITAHNAAMDCMRRVMVQGQTFEGREQNLKHAAKLMVLYERQLAALDKHRGKGQQKITVEHVTVEAGGQAIVGDVSVAKDHASAGGISTLEDEFEGSFAAKLSPAEHHRIKQPTSRRG